MGKRRSERFDRHTAPSTVEGSVARLTAQFVRMPGIGAKTAERLAYHILRISPEEAMELARAIEEVKRTVKECSLCCLLSESDPCHICSDERRDRSTICVLEDSRDAAAIEQSGSYHGLYHVLCGRLAPLEGIEPEDLTVEKLRDRLAAKTVQEVILATNPDMEGDATALFVQESLRGLPVRITRLARGVPTGSHLEYADRTVLADALGGRREVSSE